MFVSYYLGTRKVGSISALNITEAYKHTDLHKQLISNRPKLLADHVTWHTQTCCLMLQKGVLRLLAPVRSQCTSVMVLAGQTLLSAAMQSVWLTLFSF